MRLTSILHYLTMPTIVTDITTASKIALGYVILTYIIISGNMSFLALKTLSYYDEHGFLSEILQ